MSSLSHATILYRSLLEGVWCWYRIHNGEAEYSNRHSLHGLWMQAPSLVHLINISTSFCDYGFKLDTSPPPLDILPPTARLLYKSIDIILRFAAKTSFWQVWSERANPAHILHRTKVRHIWQINENSLLCICTKECYTHAKSQMANKKRGTSFLVCGLAESTSSFLMSTLQSVVCWNQAIVSCPALSQQTTLCSLR